MSLLRKRSFWVIIIGVCVAVGLLWYYQSGKSALNETAAKANKAISDDLFYQQTKERVLREQTHRASSTNGETLSGSSLPAVSLLQNGSAPFEDGLAQGLQQGFAKALSISSGAGASPKNRSNSSSAPPLEQDGSFVAVQKQKLGDKTKPQQGKGSAWETPGRGVGKSLHAQLHPHTESEQVNLSVHNSRRQEERRRRRLHSRNSKRGDREEQSIVHATAAPDATLQKAKARSANSETAEITESARQANAEFAHVKKPEVRLTRAEAMAQLQRLIQEFEQATRRGQTVEASHIQGLHLLYEANKEKWGLERDVLDAMVVSAVKKWGWFEQLNIHRLVQQFKGQLKQQGA